MSDVLMGLRSARRLLKRGRDRQQMGHTHARTHTVCAHIGTLSAALLRTQLCGAVCLAKVKLIDLQGRVP